MLGIAAHTVVGKMCRDLPLPEANVRIGERLLRGVFRTGQPRKFEFSIPSAEEMTQYEVRFVPELSPDGSVAAVLAIGRDITEAKRIEQALRQHERDVETLLDNSPDVIVRLDPKRRTLFVNAAWERLTGISRKSALGKTSQELGPPLALFALQNRAFRQVLKTRIPVTVELSYPLADGPRDHEVRHIPELEDGNVSSILLIGRDITAEKRLQELAVANERDIHALTSSLMVAQEEERRRVARDIHDSLCQGLSVLTAEIGGALQICLPPIRPKNAFRRRVSVLC